MSRRARLPCPTSTTTNAGLADELPDGTSALVLAVEHLWAVPLRDAVRDAGGIVLANRALTAEDLVGLGLDLADDTDG